MKKIYIILLLAIATLPLRGEVRRVMEQGRVSVVQEGYYLQGDSVYVRMSIALNEVKMLKHGFALLTPEIKNDSLDVSLELPPVMINGRQRQKAYRRLVALHRAPVDAGQVIDGSGRNASKTYRYAAAVAYEPWMRSAVLGVREDQCECNGPVTPIRFRFITTGLEDRNPPKSDPVREIELSYAVSFKVPNPEPVKNRTESGRAYLDFAAGRAELRPDYRNNTSELSAIGGLIRRIDGDPNTTVTQIVIDGYASPEGSYETNLKLSGQRAAALRDYLRTAYGLREGLFRVTGRGEDWSGLEQLLEASDKSYRDAALSIIRGTDVFDGRERKLMELRGGGPYREMLSEMFPRLRHSDYELHYTVIPFTVEQGRRTIETDPQLMSLNEMFLVAESYRAGSPQSHRVFDIAARLFPESDIANLNAAANALAAKNIDDAERYLHRVSARDAAWENNLGVVCALRGELEQAAKRFERAAADGNLEAVRNLTELNKIQKINH